ncbi:MAG: aspartate carbamoyltransferase regulatory subunit [Candidatus Micrarchaeota archaeon]|nr:aspartate carbamoyltransferase regulatory subunit [Candidatus Micrarchaeota archaeon]
MPLKVEKIAEGTVIDHIKAGTGTRVLALLSNTYPLSKMVALIINAESKKLGRKDILKIEGVFLDEKTTNRVSLISPHATINIIKEGKVVEKRAVETPKSLSGVVKCPNPKCITNTERAETTFMSAGKERFRCRHCERLFSPEELA